jgi:hypothetical protein
MGSKPPQVSYLTEADGTMRVYRDGCISVVLIRTHATLDWSDSQTHPLQQSARH